MKKIIIFVMLLFVAIPCQAAEELKDYLIRGMPDYKIHEQTRNFNQLTVNTMDPVSKKAVKTDYEGNRVFSEYRYGGDKAAKPGNLQVKRYYQAALQKLGGEVLWEDDANFHASFKRSGKQFYMTLSSSGGDRYQVYILEEAELKSDVNIIDGDGVFIGMTNYNLSDQKKNFDQLVINSLDPESKKSVKTTYEGNRTFADFRYSGDKVTRPGYFQIKRYYQGALRKRGGEVLWEDDASFHASFMRNGRQFYITVGASSGGDRYQVNILELTDLDIDVEILIDDIADDEEIIDDTIIIDDIEIIDDAEPIEPVTPHQDESNISKPTKNILSELTRIFKKPADTTESDYYTLGNDKIPSIIKVVGQRNVVKSETKTIDGVLAMIVEYSTDPADHTQAANDVAIYFQYLRANESFVALKSFDGLPYEGGVEMSFAKNSVDSGNIIILDIDYNMKGYTLLFRKGVGTITRP